MQIVRVVVSPFTVAAGCFVAFCVSCSAQLSCRLEWDASPSSSVAGYRVYHGFQSRDYPFIQNVGTNLSCVLSNLLPGTKYYIALTAYTTNGLESDFSEEVVFQAEQATQPYVRLSATLRRSTDLAHWTQLEAPPTDVAIEPGLPVGYFKFRRLRLEMVEPKPGDARVVRVTPVFARSFNLVNWSEFDGAAMELVATKQQEFFGVVQTRSELKQP